MAIKAIIFDCFGVLTADVWQEFVGSLQTESAMATRELTNQYRAGFLELDDFLLQAEEITKVPGQELRELITSSEGKNIKLLSYIGELKASYKIGIISNMGSDWISREFLTNSEQQLFNDMTLSYEAGAVKPNPDIYLLACKRLVVEPGEAVFIDDIADYCEAARALGMKAVHYKNFRQFKVELHQILNSK